MCIFYNEVTKGNGQFKLPFHAIGHINKQTKKRGRSVNTGLIKQHSTSPLIGVQIITGSGELFNHVATNGPMWYEDGDREVRFSIIFSDSFQKLPHVTLGVTGMDSSKSQNLRFTLMAEDVTLVGFDIVMRTWSDTKIARASVNWSALGQAIPSSAIRR